MLGNVKQVPCRIVLTLFLILVPLTSDILQNIKHQDTGSTELRVKQKMKIGLTTVVSACLTEGREIKRSRNQNKERVHGNTRISLISFLDALKQI